MLVCKKVSFRRTDLHDDFSYQEALYSDIKNGTLFKKVAVCIGLADYQRQAQR